MLYYKNKISSEYFMWNCIDLFNKQNVYDMNLSIGKWVKMDGKKNMNYIQKLAKVGWKEGLGKEGFVTSGKRKVV